MFNSLKNKMSVKMVRFCKACLSLQCVYRTTFYGRSNSESNNVSHHADSSTLQDLTKHANFSHDILSTHTNEEKNSSELDVDASSIKQDKEEAKTTAAIAVLMPTSTSLAKTNMPRQYKDNLIRMLFNLGSDGDLWFHKKGTPKHFPYLTRQMSKS